MAGRWRAWLGVLGSFLLVPFVVLVGASPAHACSCAMGETKDYVEWADAIFTGNLVEVDAPDPDDAGSAPGGDDVTMLVAVDEVFKGKAPAQVEVGTRSGGASCGIAPPPVGGDPWLWFVFVTDEGAYSATICGGSAPADDKVLTQVVDLVGPGSTPEADPDPDSEGTPPDDPGSAGESEGSAAEQGEGDVSDAEADGAGENTAVMWGVGGLVLLLAAGTIGVVMVRRRG